MVMYNINELFVGLKIIYNGDPYIIIDNEGVKPGKGQSFNRVRCKQLVSGKILEKTFKSGDYLESADIIEIDLIYIYYDGKFWYFMDEKNFEHFMVSSTVIGDSIKWMVSQLRYMVTFWNRIPILVTPPSVVELKIINTTPVIKRNSGSIASSGTKLATVSTGAVVKVPIFIQSGEYVKINTRTGEYISRVK